MNQFTLSLVAFLVAIGIIQAANVGEQFISVKGVLECNGRSAYNVYVKLFDHDTFPFNDDIASGTSYRNGWFELSGAVRKVSKISPTFNIYHGCKENWNRRAQGNKPCKRRISIKIPKNYTTHGIESRNVYDAGTIELGREFPDESIDCDY